MSPAAEPVDVIDEEGRTIGVVTRREMRAQHLLHRCTYVLVFNRTGDVFIHLRTATKDVYPSHWDIAVGGVVGAGETFEQGVRRELREELGIEAEPEELFPFRYSDGKSKLVGMVYRVTHEGPFRLQPEEVVRGEFVPLSEITNLSLQRPFCPDSLAVLAVLRQRWPRAFVPILANLRLLLGSGGFRTEERIRFLSEQMRAFFGPVDRLLFIPYALQDYDSYVRNLVQKGIHAGYQLDGIHRHADPQRAVREAPALFIGGGNTFRLLDTLYRFGLVDVIRQRILAGTPYLGISAGTNVACPTIRTTNDMPIIQPPSFRALDVVPLQINPHYFQGQIYTRQGDSFHEHFGETRADRIREFHEMNDTPVLGLYEGGMIRVENGLMQLLGTGAQLFRRGCTPVELEAGMKIGAVAWM